MSSQINRRKFIENSTTIGALALGSSSVASQVMANNKITIAVIGVGARGADHLRALGILPGTIIVV